MPTDAFVLKIDFERLRDRLRRENVAAAVRMWLREKHSRETTHTDIWISFARPQQDARLASEVLSRKMYAA